MSGRFDEDFGVSGRFEREFCGFPGATTTVSEGSEPRVGFPFGTPLVGLPFIVRSGAAAPPPDVPRADVSADDIARCEGTLGRSRAVEFGASFDSSTAEYLWSTFTIARTPPCGTCRIDIRL